jgi:hypothetical protein
MMWNICCTTRFVPSTSMTQFLSYFISFLCEKMENIKLAQEIDCDRYKNIANTA